MKTAVHLAAILRLLPALALTALGLVSTASAATSNWRLHTGTTTYGLMTWGEIQRDGNPDPRTTTTVLDTWTWIWGQEEGLNSGRSQLGVNAFMSGIEADSGEAFRTEMRAKADALIAAMKAKNNGHKVYWQIGNEINSKHFGHGSLNTLGAVDIDGDGVLEEGDPATGQVDELDNFGTMRDWAVYNGRAYPHPLTPQDGSGGTPGGLNDRGYIPYFIEYFMAPTIQAIMDANAAEPDPNFRIKIMTGSIANSDNVEAQDNWVPAFLGYTIQGTYCAAGSPLIGKTVKEAVDLLSMHYLMKAQNQLILDDYYDTWVSLDGTGTSLLGTPTTITGIITTEEIGVAAAEGGFGAIKAMQVFARYSDVWLSRNLTHQQGALCFYGTNNDSTANILSCKADYAMTKLDEFLPGASNNFSAYADIVSTDSSLALETTGFKNQDDGKRVIFLSPQSTSAHTLSLATMAGSGWTGNDATVSARVFTTGGETIPAATITRNASTGDYDIALSPAVDMSTESKVVMLYVTAPTTPPPAAPTGLTATAGNAQVALSWSASSGATSYNVKRSTTSGGPYTTIASPTTPSYTDTTVTNGTTYYYVVSAVNAGGESANSAQASATPTTPPPAAPTGLTATAGDAQVALSWSASSGATSYNVKRSTTSGGPYTTIASPTTPSYTDTTVTNGTTYYYVVSAVNVGGESANSAQASATPQVPPPAAPTGLAATAGNAQVALSWTASSGATSYNVKRSATSGGPYTTIASPTTPSHTDTTVTNGTTYYYVVSAVNAGGESANSAQASATPQAAQTTTATFESVAAEDGRIRETTETSGVGGAPVAGDNTTSSLRVGDSVADREFRSVVSFDTSSIPDGATIISATLKLTRGTVAGTNPFTILGTCLVDIRNGGLNGNTALEAADFQAAATATNVVTGGMSNPTANGAQSTGALGSAGLAAVNKTGKTQFRVYFTTGDNDDGGDDYMGFYSGEATQANRPKLEVVYQ